MSGSLSLRIPTLETSGSSPRQLVRWGSEAYPGSHRFPRVEVWLRRFPTLRAVLAAHPRIGVQVDRIFQGLATIGVPCAALALVVLGIRLGIPQRRLGMVRALVEAVLAATVLGILMATLTPIDMLGDTALPHRPAVNLVPFQALVGTPLQWATINFLMFLPFGALLRARLPSLSVVSIVASGAALSVAVELSQLLHPLRVTNIDDVLLNTAAVAVGSLVTTAALRARNRVRNENGSSMGQPSDR